MSIKNRKSSRRNVENQHRHIATLQRRWRTDALKDARYNRNRAHVERKSGNKTLAKAYDREADLDLKFAKYRGNIVKKETKIADLSKERQAYVTGS